MNYDHLINSRQIRHEKVSTKEIRQALELAERDLKTARTLINQDWDWSFAIAYNAVLQASRAYMFSRGFRPASNESHKNTFAFMRLAVSPDYEDMITYFDRMRVKRNQTIYDMAGAVTETEARSIIEKAESFLEMIYDELGDANR